MILKVIEIYGVGDILVDYELDRSKDCCAAYNYKIEDIDERKRPKLIIKITAEQVAASYKVG